MGLRDFSKPGSGEGGRRSETDSPVSPDSPMRALNLAWARGERGARDPPTCSEFLCTTPDSVRMAGVDACREDMTFQPRDI